MNANFSRCLSALVLSGFLVAVHSAPAATAKGAEHAAKPPSAYPQIVRLSYVEGDVRISRGKLADKEHEGDGSQTTGWEQAAISVPIETGDSLVTGTGRAEIEFEDASTVYLADNSVLTFDRLTSTAGASHTEMSLLAGTATLDVQSLLPGEEFILHTPSDSISMKYPQGAYARVDSYLDAITITPLQNMTFHFSGLAETRPLIEQQTYTFRNGRRVMTPAAADVLADSDWDKWVAARAAARDAAMSAAMMESGLTAPIPGLAEMNGQGAPSFSCEPYGICWEPAKGWDGHATDNALAESQPVGSQSVKSQPSSASVPESATQVPAQQASLASAPRTSKASKVAGQSAADAYLAAHSGATLRTEDYTFPCSAGVVRDLIARDPLTGKETVIESEFEAYGYAGAYPLLAGYPHGRLSPFRGFDAFFGYYPWDWGVCHAGSWIRWRHRYVWVAGTRRHHQHPVHWVKSGRTVGFVPIHPRDVAGKLPINLKEGIFKVTEKHGVSLERVGFDPGKPVELLDEQPKEFREPMLEPLKIAEAPHPMAHSVYEATRALRSPATARETAIANPAAGRSAMAGPAAKGLAGREQGTPIAFDRKSQSFAVVRQVMQGGRPSTVVVPLGSSMARSSSSALQGNRTASNSGSYSGGTSRASAPAPSYGGGGGSASTHSGGSSSGGGLSGSGGGHSGGGGGGAGGGAGGAGGGGGGGSHK